MSEDRTNKGYDDKKEFICVSCGDTVMATKFASQKTIKCDRCKSEGRPIDPNIVAEAMSKNGPKSHHAHVESTDDKDNTLGDRKMSKCTVCGQPWYIGKFASHQKTICDDCRGKGEVVPTSGEHTFRVDLTKVDRSRLPNMDELYVLPTVINNPYLRDPMCPACHKEHMKIIKINDCSPETGLVIMYQCTGCQTTMTVSEQATHMIQPAKSHIMFNYRGEEIIEMISGLTDTRVKNSMEYMHKLLVDNHIPIDGIDVPIVLRRIDKQIPIGFADSADTAIAGAIVDVIGVGKCMETTERIDGITDDGPSYIQFSDTDAMMIMERLYRCAKVITDYVKYQHRGDGVETE